VSILATNSPVGKPPSVPTLPHAGNVLPDITQKPKHGIDELKQRLIDTWDSIPQGIIDEATDQLQPWLRACVKTKGRHFKHLL